MFLPVLEDRVHALVTSGIGAPDAFSAEPAVRAQVPRPLAKSAANMVALVDSLFSMLLAAPFHQESYARLIVLTLVEYYRLCNDRFKALVSLEDGSYLAAALLAQRPDFAAARDAAREMHLLHSVPIRSADLVTSRKRQLALGTLHHSLHWFTERIEQLSVKRDGPPAALELPLEPAHAQRYALVPSMYRQLARTLLDVMRTELRTRTVYYIDLALREGSYIVDAVSLDPDPYIVDLNTELAACHEAYRETVLPPHHQYLFDGLDVLMDELLVHAVTVVRAVNRHGVTKMIRNILSLQQNLKNIVAAPLTVDLERAKRMWELVGREPATWVTAPDSRIAPEHYLAALRLAHGVADPDAAVRIPHAGIARSGSFSAHNLTLRTALGM